MGRSIASAAQLIRKQVAQARLLRGALSRSDQLILDDFFESTIQHQAPLANAASLLPLEAMLLVMQLEERKRAVRLLAELRADIRALRPKQP